MTNWNTRILTFFVLQITVLPRRCRSKHLIAYKYLLLFNSKKVKNTVIHYLRSDLIFYQLRDLTLITSFTVKNNL